MSGIASLRSMGLTRALGNFREKANEIYVKTEHDFSLEKQIKVHQAKLRIQAEYKQKEKDADTQRRIQRAIVSGEVRIRKMQKRDELVQKVKQAAIVKLASAATSNPTAYAELLKKLIIQGLIKLNESRVEVQCREVDLPIVRKVLEPAAREYEKMILDSCKESIKVEVVLLEGKMLPGPTATNGSQTCAGGVKISAK